MLWFGSEFFTEVEYQQDLDKHLGLPPEDVPVVALPPLPISKLGKKLNISDPKKAMYLAKILSSRVASGFLPNGWDKKCKKNYHPALCQELDRYFKWTKRSRNGRKAISRRSRVRFKSSTISGLQKTDLGVLLSKAKKVQIKTLKKWSKIALKTTDCPRNASVALARMWEYHLQREGSYGAMNGLDDHGAECMTPEQSDFEYVNMRIGLWAVAIEDWERAELFLEKATTAKHQREPYRVNYWLSKVYENLGKDGKVQDARVAIRRDYPLSWFAIESSLDAELDPMELVLGMEPFTDKYFSGKPDFDRSIAWFYLMSRLEGASGIQKYISYIYYRLDEEIPVGVYQHIARVMESGGNYRQQIMVLRKLFNLSSANVNVESLRLYFPRPFYDVVDANAPTLDNTVLLGLMRQESGFDPRARSGANAMGLLQILPRTARDIRRRTAAKQLYDSNINIEIGSAYFSRLIDYFKGSVERSLAAYNAGMGRVRGWSRNYGVEDEQLFMDLIPYRETREYVSSILRNGYWYHRLFPIMSKDINNGVKTSKLLKYNLDRGAPLQLIVPLHQEEPLGDFEEEANNSSEEELEQHSKTLEN